MHTHTHTHICTYTYIDNIYIRPSSGRKIVCLCVCVSSSLSSLCL